MARLPSAAPTRRRCPRTHLLRRTILTGAPRRAEETTLPQLALVPGRRDMRRRDSSRRRIPPPRLLLPPARLPHREITHGAPLHGVQTCKQSHRHLPVLLPQDGTHLRWSPRPDAGTTARAMLLCEWAWEWACGPTRNRRTNTSNSNKPLGRYAAIRSPGSRPHRPVRRQGTIRSREAPCRPAPSEAIRRAAAASRRRRLGLRPATRASPG